MTSASVSLSIERMSQPSMSGAPQTHHAANCSLYSSKVCVAARLLDGKDLALLFVNFGDSDAWGRFHLERVGLPYQSGMKLKMRDVFTKKVTYSGRDTVPYNIPPHTCQAYRCTPVPA